MSGVIVNTERLVIREAEAERDAAFIFELFNTPKFIRYIGDRKIDTPDAASRFISEHYQRSYRDNGFGLWCVETNAECIGMCGFVKRDVLDLPDLGFAFLPEAEGKGYAYEAAAAVLEHGRTVLELTDILAITTPDNEASQKLLRKLGFERDVDPMLMPDGSQVTLFRLTL